MSSLPGGGPSVRRAALCVLLVLAVAGVVIAQLRRAEAVRRTVCLSNLRRLSTALLLYSQDHDGRLPPHQYQTARKEWRHWVDLLGFYIRGQSITRCPAQPDWPNLRDPYHGIPFESDYALNRRFFGVFGPGPFPIENVELPGQTVLLVEAGPYRHGGPFAAPSYPWAMIWYWDTAWWPNAYGSPHSGLMNVATADGKAVTLKVEHYTKDGHDALHGRLGKAVYNWNGGFPNKRTDGAPLE